MADNYNALTYYPMVYQSAKDAGINPSVYTNLISSESSFNPYAYNSSGAAGLAQFMPGTAKELGINPYDAQQSSDGGAQYLAKLYKKYGNYRDAIAAYKGYGNNLSAGYARADSVLAGTGFEVTGDSPTLTASKKAGAIAGNAAGAALNKPKDMSKYGMFSGLLQFFSDTARASIMFVLGILIVIFSLYMLATEHDISLPSKS